MSYLTCVVVCLNDRNTVFGLQSSSALHLDTAELTQTLLPWSLYNATIRFPWPRLKPQSAVYLDSIFDRLLSAGVTWNQRLVSRNANHNYASQMCPERRRGARHYAA